MKNKLTLLFSGLFLLGISTFAYADNCMQKYQGLNITEVSISNAFPGGQVICSYKPSVYYIDKYHSKPVSGPWQDLGLNTYRCLSSQASTCVFS